MRHFDTELAPSVSHQLPPLHKHCLPPPPITTSNMKAVRPLSRGDNHTATHATAAAPPLTKCATSPSQQARMPSAEEQAPCFECDFDLHPLMKTCGSVLPDQSLSCDGSDVRPAPTTTQRLLDASTPSTPCRPTWRCFSCGESFAANAAIYVSDECKATFCALCAGTQSALLCPYHFPLGQQALHNLGLARQILPWVDESSAACDHTACAKHLTSFEVLHASPFETTFAMDEDEDPAEDIIVEVPKPKEISRMHKALRKSMDKKTKKILEMMRRA